MKKYLAVFIAFLFVALPTAAFGASGMGDGIILDEQASSPFDPEAGKVLIWVDTTSTPVLYMTDDASTDTALTSLSSVTLDGAYNASTSSAKKITVDDGVFELETGTDGIAAFLIDHNDVDNDTTAFQITNDADAANAISIDIDAQTTGRDIEGTGASWYVDGNGNLTVNNITVGGTLGVTGATTLSGSLYQAAIVAAAAGNVALSLNPAGTGVITIGDATDAGAVTITPATTIVGNTTLTGSLTANGAVTLGDATTDDITITGYIVADTTFNDGTTHSPKLIFMDDGDDNWYIQKLDTAAGNLSVTANVGTSDFQIFTGNLKVGNGSESVTLNGEDAYIEGTFENAGGATFTGNTTFTGAANLFTLGAAEYVKIDADSTAHTGTAGALDINFDSKTDNACGIHIAAGYVTGGGDHDVTAILIDLDDDANATAELIGMEVAASDSASSAVTKGVKLMDSLEIGLEVVVGAATLGINIDGASTDHTGTAGLIAIAMDTKTSTASAIEIDMESLTGGTNDEVSAILINLVDTSNSAGEISGLTIDSTTPGGSSRVIGVNFTDPTGAATGLTECIAAELPADGVYLTLDAATVDSTTTGGLINIDHDTKTTAGMAMNMKTTLLTGSGAGVYVGAIYIDVDDDSNAASFITGITIDSTDATDSSEVRGIAFETIAGADTLLDVCIFAEADADTVVLKVDGDGTAYTGAEGLLDIGMTSATANAAAINVDITHVAGGSGQKIAGIEIEIGSDADDSSDETYGLLVNATDTTDTGTLTGVQIQGAGLDIGMQVDTGGVWIGTGSNADETQGDDTLFVEGTIEVDGVAYFDGNIDADAAIIGAGEASTFTGFSSTTADVTDAVSPAHTASHTVYHNASESGTITVTLPEASTVLGCQFTFVVIVAQLIVVNPDNADIVLGLCTAAGDEFESNTVGDTITIMAIDDTNWVVIASSNVNGSADAWADGDIE